MKNTLPTTGQKKRGFTLIELLIVISIIAVLAAMAFPVSNKVILAAKKAQCNQEIGNIMTSLKAYQMEYGHLPINGTSDVDELSLSGGGGTAGTDLMLCLMGIDDNPNPSGLTQGTYTNPKQMPFYEPKYTQDIRAGWNQNDGALYDPFGNAYVVSLDTDFDKYITNPEGSMPGPSELRTDVLVYSLGDVPPGTTMVDWNKALKSWD